MIVYSYFLFEQELNQWTFDSLLRTVPLAIRQKVLRYRKWQDRHNCLFGKLMLRDLLVNYFDQSQDCLEHLRFNAYGKPFLNQQLDFNISHSHELVICAISDDCRIGIDVEKKLDLELHELNYCLRADERCFLAKANNNDLLYEFWTQKESVLKACGTGMATDLQDIHLLPGHATIANTNTDDELWYLTSLDLHEGYSATLCMQQSDVPIYRIKLENYYREKLLVSEPNLLF